MFNESVNAPCINALFISRTIGAMPSHAMHDSMLRLLKFVREASRDTDEPITSFAEIGNQMGKTSAVLTNWKKRGISQSGALLAEQLFGCSARWLLTGEGMAHAALSDEALQRATLWQRMNESGRRIFDKAMDFARAAEGVAHKEPLHNAREKQHRYDQPTVPGDLEAKSVVVGRGGANPPKKKIKQLPRVKR